LKWKGQLFMHNAYVIPISNTMKSASV